MFYASLDETPRFHAPMLTFHSTEPCNKLSFDSEPESKLSNGHSMGTVQCCQSNKYMPGQQLIESARFAPMKLSPCGNANSNPGESKKVHLVHASILAAVEAEMARIYKDSPRSSDDCNHDAAQRDGHHKCSNISGMHHYSNEKTELVQQHGLNEASSDLVKNGESSQVGLFAVDSHLATENSAGVAASIGSVGHDWGLCNRPCNAGERKRRQKKLREHWHGVVSRRFQVM